VQRRLKLRPHTASADLRFLPQSACYFVKRRYQHGRYRYHKQRRQKRRGHLEGELWKRFLRNDQSCINAQWWDSHLYGTKCGSDACRNNDHRYLCYRRHQVGIRIHHHYVDRASASYSGIVCHAAAIHNGDQYDI
jgi:hypothetical protein